MIEVHNLVFKYNTHIILDDLSFDLKENETTVVMGSSGVGKSTLLRCVLGLEKPASGSILVDGADITQMDEEELNLIRQAAPQQFYEKGILRSPTSENYLVNPHSGKDKIPIGAKNTFSCKCRGGCNQVRI